MRFAPTTVLALAGALTASVCESQEPEEPLEEIIVTGEYAGPGMWQVTHPDHPGHVLWIVGEPPPLPSGMTWRSQQVERTALQSQEILLQGGFSLKPDQKIGMLRMLTLVPAALKLRKNPDDATLKDLLPPDVYSRWLVQKKRYLGRDSGVEKMRPMLVAEKLRNAAFKELQLGGGGAWGAIQPIVTKNKIPVTSPSLDFTFKTEGLRRQIKSFAHQKLADEECFALTVDLAESLSNKPVESIRARAWATGDLATLQGLPPLPNPDPSCEKAIVDSLAMTTPVPANLLEQMDELWFAAAGKALATNASTLAFVSLDDLLGDQGHLEVLRGRGYQIVPPAID